MICRSLEMLLIIGVVASTTRAQRPAGEEADRANIDHLVHQLTDEALNSQREGTLARDRANFAEHWHEYRPPPAEVILNRVVRRIHRDPFVDAYVRWQLTSFSIEIDSSRIDDRAFERLMQSLPTIMENPRADQALIRTLQQASARGVLTEAQQNEVNTRLNRLAAQASAAQAMNVPADHLHQWLLAQFRSQPHRVLTLMLHRAAGRARAGWSVEEDKSQIDRVLATSARSREFTPSQRREVVSTAEDCMASARMFLAGAGVTEGAVALNVNTTGIFDYDVRRWAKVLADEQ